MSNQPAPTRPWFRLASMARPAPQAPSPTLEPAPAPPRPATVRPAFRPAVQAQPPPTAGGVSSVPTSPVGRASQPSSPAADKKPTTSPTVPLSAATSSVPSSPVKTAPTVTATATAAGPTTSPPKTAITASLPSSPAKPAPTTTSLTSSPTQKPASHVTTTARVPSPKASTTTAKPATQYPIQSPKTKPPTAPPPSPLTLPPSQLKAQAELEAKIPAEAEQKTVLVQKTIDKPKGYPQKDLGDTRKPSIPLNGQKEPSKEGETKEKSHGKKFSSDSEDAGMRIITIAGENKGAFMEIIQSPNKNGFHSSSSEEGDRKMKDKSNSSKTMPMNAFMNSNVQGINNSIVFNSSCTLHDPGVHLTLHRKPNVGGSMSMNAPMATTAREKSKISN